MPMQTEMTHISNSSLKKRSDFIPSVFFLMGTRELSVGQMEISHAKILDPSL